MKKRNTMILIVLVFIVMSIIIPLSYGDDLDWGGQGGIERLGYFFQGYNGRYLGNLVIMAISRSLIVRVIFYTIVNSGIILLMNKLVEYKHSSSLIFSLFLLYAIPSKIYGQTFGWYAGFANYNVGIFLTLLTIYLVKSNNNIIFIILSAFLSQFLMENITIFNIFASLILIFILKKIPLYKRFSYFIFSIFGAIIMFMNPVYHAISNDADGYRSINFDLLHQVLVKDYVNYLLVGNVVLVIALTILSLGISNEKNSILNYFIVGYSVVILLMRLNDLSTSRIPFSLANILTVASFLYLLSIAVIIKKSNLSNNLSILLIFFGVSAGLILSPFLVIVPFGPRAAFTSYVFLAIVATALWDYAIEELQYKIVVNYLYVGTVSLVGFLLIIHSFNRYTMINRITHPISKSDEEIVYTDVPFPNYGQHLSPPVSLYISPKTFKEKHNIDENTKISFIPYEPR